MPDTSTDRLGIRAYARHRKARGLPGATHTAVQKAIAEGRITQGADGLIDPAQADREWAANTRGAATSAPADLEAAGDDASPAALFNKARAAKEYALAQLRQLELEEKRGNLVTLDFMEAEMAAALQVVRGFLVNLPAGLAPRLIACTTVGEMQEVLQEEVDRVMRGLSGTGAEEGAGDGADAPGRRNRVA